MRAIHSSGVRKNLSKVLDSVVDDFEPVIVTRRGDKTGQRVVVIMALTSYNRMIETFHVLSGDNRAHIMKSTA